MTGLEVAILTHDDTHCGHVPCRPPSITRWRCRCTAGWGKHHAIVIFRIKWVWIWLGLSDTRVSSRGAFFGRIDDPSFQKKKLYYTTFSPQIYCVLPHLKDQKHFMHTRAQKTAFLNSHLMKLWCFGENLNFGVANISIFISHCSFTRLNLNKMGSL